ncbi:glycogen/starch synthase [uncultured Muribaculum sp.]|uniref:glycogen/starch synthase n=1 Tax=uncultured Muribaculum sp. TaxID=1918613 RepID=UPI0025963B55|nr:glycogen/starch synthase [uncultured Muribaculum sp.]
MDINKVLYISQEITPYLPATQMSELSQKLPQGIQEHGSEVRTFMPKYGSIKERRNQLHEVIRLSGLNIVIDDTDHPLIIKVATLQPSRMQVYFIDNEDYFLRGQSAKELELTLTPDDNDERIMFYARGVVETVKKLRWDPTLIHCSGWVSAMAPLYLKCAYADDPSFANSKIVYSVFDSKFDGTLDPRLQEKLKLDGFSDSDIAALGDKPVDIISLHKLAIDHSDAVAQSSPEIPQEVLDYIKASGKPFLPYPGDTDYVEKYAEFYKSL